MPNSQRKPQMPAFCYALSCVPGLCTLGKLRPRGWRDALRAAVGNRTSHRAPRMAPQTPRRLTGAFWGLTANCPRGRETTLSDPPWETPGWSFPLLKAEPLSAGQEHGLPKAPRLTLAAVQSDQKSGVFATGIGYS